MVNVRAPVDDDLDFRASIYVRICRVRRKCTYELCGISKGPLFDMPSVNIGVKLSYLSQP